MFSIAADERAAMQFADLASALDAGLPLEAVGGDASAGDRAVHAAIHERGVKLTPTEDLVLLHAWRAGRIGAALRGRARERQRRADFVRELWSGLRYPLVLAGMVLLASAATAMVAGFGLLVGLSIAYAVLGAFALAVRAGIRTNAPWVQRLPLVESLALEAGELPYLETLHALYGAGVALPQAHRAAVATVRVAALGARLRTADAILGQGRPLREALAESAALHSDTRTLLATGEQSGQLEDALQRALDRRRDVVVRRTTTVARNAGRIAYAVAAVVVVVIVWRFYSNLYGGLRLR